VTYDFSDLAGAPQSLPDDLVEALRQAQPVVDDLAPAVLDASYSRQEPADVVQATQTAATEPPRGKLRRQLTPREEDVLAVIVQQPQLRTADLVAAVLGLHPYTVRHHLTKIARAFGLTGGTNIIGRLRRSMNEGELEIDVAALAARDVGAGEFYPTQTW
jgi:DNA-binding CsgD family transcriptional regulator